MNVCNICNAGLKTKDGLKIHQKRKHFDNVKAGCEICGGHYSTKYDLRNHVNTVHKYKTHECEYCRKVFLQKQTLIKHMKSVHVKIKYQCTLCSYQASWETNLWSHTKSVHEKSTYVSSMHSM